MEVIVAFLLKNHGYKFPQKRGQCLIRLCIAHTASTGLYTEGVKGYLLMPLIIHRTKNCSTCSMTVSVGHRRMNKTRS